MPEPSTNTLNRSASSFFKQFVELARRHSHFLRLGIRRGGDGALAVVRLSAPTVGTQGSATRRRQRIAQRCITDDYQCQGERAHGGAS